MKYFLFLLLLMQSFNVNSSIIPSDQAIKVSHVFDKNNNQIIVTFDVHEDHVVYANKLKHIITGKDFAIQKTILEKAVYNDILEENVFPKSFNVKYHVFSFSNKVSGNLVIDYQGCNIEIGVCLSPQKYVINI